MSEAKPNSESVATSNRRTAWRLAAATCVMFAFGYALVPLYNVFCDITGLNGKTGRLSVAEAQATTIDSSRLVTVEFVTNVNAGLPWQFRPLVNKIEVHPGAETGSNLKRSILRLSALRAMQCRVLRQILRHATSIKRSASALHARHWPQARHEPCRLGS